MSPFARAQQVVDTVIRPLDRLEGALEEARRASHSSMAEVRAAAERAAVRLDDAADKLRMGVRATAGEDHPGVLLTRPSPSRFSTRIVRAAPWVAAGAVLAVGLRLMYGPGFPAYDAAWALVWGDEIAGGHLPSYQAPFAPTPHPLLNVFTAAVSPLGRSVSETVLVAVVYVAMATLVLACARLGRVLFSWPVGIVFAGLVVACPLLMTETRQAVVDIPFLAAVAIAALAALRRPPGLASAFAALTVAGLLRPEGWVLLLAYAWMCRRQQKLGSLAAVAAVLTAPIIWAVTDLLVTGNPLHSFVGTRDLAATLDRPRGLATAVSSGPALLTEITHPVFGLMGVVGAVLAVLLWYSKALPPLVVGALVLMLFFVFGVLGLPLLTRYLLLPGLVLLLFAAVALAGWTTMPRGSGERRTWGVVAIVCAAVTIAVVPSRVHDFGDQRRAIGARGAVLDDLVRVASSFKAQRCSTAAVPAYSVRPVVARALGIEPAAVRDGRQADGLTFVFASVEAATVLATAPDLPPTGRAALTRGPILVSPSGSWLVGGRC